jgi:hypothetical protein
MDNKSLKMAPSNAVSANQALSGAVAAKSSVRPFASKAKKKQKENFFIRLRSSAGFTITIGLLITGFGLMCFIPFRNQFGKIMLVLGLLTTFFGFIVKFTDILLRIILEGRS